MSINAFAAAAPACCILSRTSFGDSAQPAIKTPAVGASTGFNFGCCSMRKPSEVVVSVRAFLILLLSSRGNIPVASTIISTSCCSILPLEVSSMVRMRFFVFGSSSICPGIPLTKIAPCSLLRLRKSSNPFPKVLISI